MPSVTPVEQDLELARQLASSLYSNFAAKATPSLNGLQHFVRLCGPSLDQTGTYTVTVLLERVFVNSRITDSSASHFVVCAEWKVLFGPSYPTEPCAWYFDKDCNTDRTSNPAGDTARLRGRLRFFLVKEVVSRLSLSSSRAHTTACAADVNKHNDYCSRMTRVFSRKLSSQVLLPVATNSLTAASARLEEKCSDGVIPVPQFLLDFTFLCNWWMSLELDDGCIVPANYQMLGSVVSVGNMVATEEDGSGGIMCSSHAAHFLEGGSRNRGQLPKRGFTAVFTPHGEVLMWGLGSLNRKTTTQAKKVAGDMPSGKSEMSTGGANFFFHTQYGSPVSSSLQTHSSHNNSNSIGGSIPATVPGSAEFTEIHQHGNQHNHYHHNQWRGLHIASFSSRGINEVLPSLVVPKNILHTNLYSIHDVCLCAEDPAKALMKNIRICKEGTELRSVLNAFRMLRQLVKGASPHTPSLYTVKLLAPALHNVVKELQLLHKPFWAGVAVCCFILPSLLIDYPALLDLASLLIDTIESYRCVSLVATVFSIVDSDIQFREAEIAKKMIEDVYCASKPYLNSPDKVLCVNGTEGGFRGRSSCSSKSDRKGGMRNNSSLITGHPPITECAVCRLPLPHRPIRSGAHDDGECSVNNHVSNSTCCSPYSSSSACNSVKYGHRDMGDITVKGGSRLLSGNDDGCLTLQCVRCGHGGHVDHILAWWDDSNVRCCPMGCDCRCFY